MLRKNAPGDNDGKDSVRTDFPRCHKSIFEAAELNEKQKRLFMGMLADQYGPGGGQAVCEAFQVGHCTVTKGKAGVSGDRESRSSVNRVRRPGGGRTSVEASQQGMEEAVNTLLESRSYGHPESSKSGTTPFGASK